MNGTRDRSSDRS